MTPMQSLKNHFDSFKNLLPEVFKELSLNKSEDRTFVLSFCGDSTEYSMKGVRSDFIKTFKAKFNDQDSYSIGFSFKYLNVPDVEQTVQVSLKIGNKYPLYYKGEHLLVEDFRVKFSNAVKKIDDLEDKNCKTIVNLVKEDFNLLPNHHAKEKVHSQRKKKNKM